MLLATFHVAPTISTAEMQGALHQLSCVMCLSMRFLSDALLPPASALCSLPLGWLCKIWRIKSLPSPALSFTMLALYFVIHVSEAGHGAHARLWCICHAICGVGLHRACASLEACYGQPLTPVCRLLILGVLDKSCDDLNCRGGISPQRSGDACDLGQLPKRTSG